jgi:hypothetical protein
MDNFIVYGNTFDEAMNNLENLLKICQEKNLSLSHEKCHMILTKGIILGHHICPSGIHVNPTKIELITKLPVPMKQKDVNSFLGHVEYYCHFIENFTEIASSLFTLL